MLIDRDLHAELLVLLKDVYPRHYDLVEPPWNTLPVTQQLHYLAEFGLVQLGRAEKNTGLDLLQSAKITARGLDYLAEDGGLSADLDTITVRLHIDTLEAITRVIQASARPPAEQKRLIAQLRTLPAAAIKHLTTKLVDLALEHSPEAFQLIEKVIEGGRQ